MILERQGRLEALRCLIGTPANRREKLVDFQSKQLKRLVKHAYETVPYYRRRFDEANFHPSQYEGLESLSLIPLSGKAEMLSGGREALLSQKISSGRLLKTTTTGSTGTPFPIYRTWFEDRFLRLLRVTKLLRLGLRVIDRRVYIRYSDPSWFSRRAAFLGRIGLSPLLTISPFLDPKDVATLLSDLKPDVLQGYANMVYLVSSAADSLDQGIRLRMVLVGGETLTSSMRRGIESSFQCRVKQIYASHEFNMIALECPSSHNLHICDESVILEVLKDGRPVAVGERGEVVLTALHSFAQPFIRFRLGDLVTKGGDICSCGLESSTIHEVAGRKADRIRMPDGRFVSPFRLFEYLTREQPWVQQHQIVQETGHFVALKLVASRKPEAEELAAVEGEMTGLLGPEVDFQVFLVREIPTEPGGKFRVSRSHVYSHYDD